MKNEVVTLPVNHSYEGLMQGLAGGIFPGGNPLFQTPISQQTTLMENSPGQLITLNRALLNNSYASGGIVTTVIDQPVDDAFKGGLIIKSDELDEKDLKLFYKNLKKKRIIHSIKQGIKWGRLFGGAGLVIATDQDPLSPLNIEGLGEEDPLQFVPADRWEFSNNRVGVAGYPIRAPYMYYTQMVDWSRVIRIMGREAPSLIRFRLGGWGLSSLEMCLPDINQFYRLRSVIFELVDQAKIDVYRLQGLNDLLMTSDGTQKAIMRVMIANMIKSYKSALVLDQTDEYEQKTQTFSGLADLLEQAMICLSAATRIPVNKLFGQSATGFSSGEDAMENYNALIEADIREPNAELIDEVLSIVMQQTFGYVPDFEAEFYPLREVDPVEEEAIKTSKQKRIIELRTADQIDGEEADEILHKEGLLDIDTAVGRGERTPEPDWAMGKDDPAAAEGAAKKEKPIKKPKQSDHSREARVIKFEWLKQEMKKTGFRRTAARKMPAA